MKKLLLSVFLSAFLFLTVSSAQAQYVTIPDANFRAFLETKYPDCMSGGKLDTTCSAIISEEQINVENKNISDLTGIEHFDGLLYLFCFQNNLPSLPPLPQSLINLHCENNKLTSLPRLPESLTVLFCDFNSLSSLPSLPKDSMFMLSCSYNHLATIPELPSHLSRFQCHKNLLTSLPILPANMEILSCGENQITALPDLPKTLKQLHCSFNPISTLPNLPDSLNIFSCANTNISFISRLPSSLTLIYVMNNKLTVLPALSHCINLTTLNCTNNQLTCLPFLPNSLQLLSATSNIITCIPNKPSGPYEFSSDIGMTICNPTNSHGCEIYPLINGNIYVDDNNNHNKDLGENSYLKARIEIQPGNYLVTPDSTGYYETNVEIGNYTVSPKTILYYTYTPTSRTVNFTEYGQVNNDNNFGIKANGVFTDLEITITPLWQARPGREIAYNIIYTNKGTTISNGTVELNYDNLLHLLYDSLGLIEMYPSPSSVDGSEISWDFTNLMPDESRKIFGLFLLPTTVAIGTPLHLSAIVIPSTNEYAPLDNINELNQLVTGSFDPNFKEVTPASDITTEQVAAQERFTYTVHFQNTGNDTAFVVIIKDTISTNFEIQEIETIATSHNYSFKMKNGAAAWTFNNILLPDSTTNERLSHGFVKYRIIPKNTLMPGDEIKNTAHIFFDYNAPVVTNTTLNRVSMPTGLVKNTSSLMQLYPNPSKGLITITTSATGAGKIRVSNTDGKIIQDLTTPDVSKGYQLDLSNEVKGLYIIQLISNEGLMTQKVIIN